MLLGAEPPAEPLLPAVAPVDATAGVAVVPDDAAEAAAARCCARAAWAAASWRSRSFSASIS